VILLDTNVLSEVMRVNPAPEVVAWLDAQPADTLWISSITRAEIELGIATLPSGKRKQRLHAAAEAMFEEEFAARCLPFDGAAAQGYARIVAARTKLGRPISVEDAQIASIALVHGMKLATRNVADFQSIARLAIVDPWAHG